MGLIRRQKLIDRVTNTRDAKIFLVATEDEGDAVHYFEAFNPIPERRKPFAPSPVRVRPLPPQQHRSAPTQLIQGVHQFVSRHGFDPRDEIWLVMDVDHWEIDALAAVCREAQAAGYHVAIANPCFEVWLCQHFPACSDSEIAAAAQGRKAGNNLKRLWRSHLPPSATNYWRGILIPQARVARERARQSDAGDISAAQPWPTAPGTQIFQLVERILEALEER